MIESEIPNKTNGSIKDIWNNLANPNALLPIVSITLTKAGAANANIPAINRDVIIWPIPIGLTPDKTLDATIIPKDIVNINIGRKIAVETNLPTLSTFVFILVPSFKITVTGVIIESITFIITGKTK